MVSKVPMIKAYKTIAGIISVLKELFLSILLSEGLVFNDSHPMNHVLSIHDLVYSSTLSLDLGWVCDSLFTNRKRWK